MRFLAVLLLSYQLTVVIATDEEILDDISYNEATFTEAVLSKPHFVMFFAPWCGHCKALAPVWTQLSQFFNKEKTGIVTVARVDCTEQKKLCSDNEVTGYPTLKIFQPDQDAIRHRGGRDLKSLKEFVFQTLQIEDTKDDESAAKNGLYDLNSETFDGHISEGNHFIKFYAPWCGHCKRLEPTWQELALMMKDRADVKIGRVDCTQNQKICGSNEVRGYPTLLWFKNGEKTEKYEGGRTITDLTSYVAKMTDSATQNKPLTEEEKKEVVEFPVVEAAEAVDGLYELTAENFETTIAEGDVYIKFFAPWCGHCRKMEPDWKELAKIYENHEKVKIARIDCTQHSTVCRSNGVRGYPTLKYFRNGKDTEAVSRGRDLENLKKFVEEQIATPSESAGDSGEKVVSVTDGLHELTDDNFDTSTAKGDFFVKFFAPWCGHCKRLEPAWKELAKFFENSGEVKIGRVDCTTQRSVCHSKSVRGYPTLKYFRDGVEIEGGPGGRDIESLKNFVQSKIKSAGATTEKEEEQAQDDTTIENGLYELTADNFDEKIAEGHAYVKFFAPWCGHCRQMEPAWKELAKTYENHETVKIARVDCTQHSAICKSNGVRGYPTLKYFINSKDTGLSSKGRDLANLKAFVEEQLAGSDQKEEKSDEKQKVVDGLYELTDVTFESVTAEGDVFVKFFAPWCGHCKRMEPTWKELAKFFEENDKVKIGRLDCTLHSSVCQSKGVRGYPTLKYFRNGVEMEGVPNARDIKSLKTFVQSKIESAEAAADKKDEQAQDDTTVENGLYELTADNFDERIAEGHAYVKFFAPWCGHCRQMEPAWKELAKTYENHETVKIARVDCTQHSPVCKSNGVRGYPTLKYFRNGKDTGLSSKGRDLTNLKAFVEEQLAGSDQKEEKSEEKIQVIDGLYELTDGTFESATAEGDIFVKFFAPWCGHCKRMEPTWKELAKFFEKNDKVKIGRLDCTLHSSVCQSKKVRGYPTLKYFRNGVEVEGAPGGRDFEALKAFVLSKVGPVETAEPEADEVPEENGAKELTDETFQDTIDSGITFIKFFAPWCGHCKRLAPTWDELASQDFSEMTKSVEIAKVDCTKFSSICTENEVRGYPTLKLFIDGDMGTKYQGMRTLEALKNFVMQNDVKTATSEQLKDEL